MCDSAVGYEPSLAAAVEGLRADSTPPSTLDISLDLTEEHKLALTELRTMWTQLVSVYFLREQSKAFRVYIQTLKNKRAGLKPELTGEQRRADTKRFLDGQRRGAVRTEPTQDAVFKDFADWLPPV